MNIMRAQRRLFRWLGLVSLFTALVAIQPVKAQQPSQSGENTFTGTVASSTRNTLVVRSGSGQYQLFVFDRNTNKPASIPVGSQVRVISSPGGEEGTRIANDVTVVQAASSGQGGAAAPSPAIPPEVRSVERDIEREVRRYQMGVRAGLGLNPELISVGADAQKDPIFHSNVYFRPNAEFEWGEVTSMFALNAEAIYRIPSAETNRWTPYFGLGPGFNFVHRGFITPAGTTTNRIDFGKFNYSTSLNILGGVRNRNGVFVELKTGIYASPAPVFHVIVGFDF